MSSYINKQFFLIKFPILFPIFYGIILYSFPIYENLLIILTILLLAETHFGATWPFFINKVNYSYIYKNKVSLIFFPLIITFFSLIGFIFFKNLFFLIFFAANMFHVTRQSVGVCKLYSKDMHENNFQTNVIYLFNILFFFIGYFRFYYPFINSENILLINILIIISALIVLSIYIIKFNFSENFFTFLTGIIIFYPICFVDSPVHAIIMGVTMHYVQYLYLTNFISKSREEELVEKKKFGFRISNFVIIVLIYSVAMTFFTSIDKITNIDLSYLIIIPITGQLIHFYLDSHIWKFRDKHNRDNVLRHLQKIIIKD